MATVAEIKARAEANRANAEAVRQRALAEGKANPNYLNDVQARAQAAPKADYTELQNRLAGHLNAGGAAREYAENSLANYSNLGGVTDQQRAQAAAIRGETQTVAAPQTALSSTAANGMSGANDYISQLYQASLQRRMAELDKSKNAALSNLSAEKATIAPKFYDARNHAAAGSQQQSRNFAEWMAARGGARSGAAAQLELSRQGALQGNIGALNRDEVQANADIARRTTDVENSYEYDRVAALSGAETERLQALINQQNLERQFGLQEGGLTGRYNGNQTLAAQQLALQQQNQQWQQGFQQSQFDWQRDSSNPQVQAQNLQNQIAQLQLQNLPAQQQAELNLLQQQIQSGQLSIEQAQYQLSELTNPNSVTNQSKQLALQAARLGNQQLAKQIEQIGKQPALSEYDKQRQQLELQKLQAQVNQLTAPQQNTGSASDYYSVINNSPYISPVYETDPNNPFAAPRNTGRVQVNDREGLEGYILSLGLPSEEMAKLYRYYNIPMR